MEAVKRTWEYGMHRVPRASLKAGQFYSLSEIREDPQNWGMRVSQTKLKPGTKIPAVIYLHGCAGNTAGAAWSKKFDELGYAFFAPDSLARPRRSLCYQGQMKSRRIPWRTEELRYALQQLRQLGWIDQDRIILMGSSEGAQAASRYDGREFAAIVLSATDCRFSGGSPNAPSDVPVLNMVGANDTKGGGRGCRISRTVGGSRSLRIKGAGHKLPGYSQAREALEQFLNECCTKSH
jgi:poly(3-hydroxybutyrate) depolymerase